MWEEQWKRAERSFGEFKKTDDGRRHDRDSDYYKDEMLHFFMDCYHLKDWLRNDPATAKACTDVETFISGSLALSQCGDLANGAKHLTLTKTRTGDPSTAVGSKHARLGPAGVSIRWEVRSQSSTWDAFNIAEAGMNDWRTYLRSKTLIP